MRANHVAPIRSVSRSSMYHCAVAVAEPSLSLRCPLRAACRRSRSSSTPWCRRGRRQSWSTASSFRTWRVTSRARLPTRKS
eukprot:5229244-Prymnesium_polylepis.1